MSRPAHASIRNNILSLSTERVVRYVIQTIITLAVIRHLGPSEFGLLTTLASVAAIIASAQGFGMDPLIMEAAVATQADRRSVIGTAITVRTVIGVGAGIALASWAFRIDGALQIGALALIFAVALAPFDTFRADLDASRRSWSHVRLRLVVVVLYAAVQVWLIAIDAPTAAFMGALAASLGATHFASLLATDQKVAFRFSTNLLRRALPLALSTALTVVYMRVDVLMLLAILGPAEAGVYGATVRIAELPSFIAPAVVASFVGYVRRDTAGVRTLRAAFELRRMLSALNMLLLGAIITLALVGPLVISYVLGIAYSESARLLPYYLPTTLFLGWGIAKHQWLVMQGVEWHSVAGAALGLVSNVAMNLTLIPIMGTFGAVVATAVSYLLAHYVYCLAVPATRPFVHALHRSFLPRPGGRDVGPDTTTVD